MSAHKKTGALQNWLSFLKTKEKINRPFDTLKRWITGSLRFWFSMKKRERIFNKSLAMNGDLSLVTKNSYHEFQKKEHSYIFGRRLTVEQKETICELQNKDLSDRDIRVLIVNRLIDKKGNLRISNVKELFFYIVGILFIIICSFSFLLLSALVWASPLTTMYQILFEVIIIAVTIYCGYVMSYFSIYPLGVIRRTRLI